MLPLALSPSDDAMPTLGLPSALLLVFPSPSFLVESPFNQTCQLMSKDMFLLSQQVDPVRPQHILCLEDSSVIVKTKVLVEASALEPGVDVFGSPVSSSVSPHYWED